MLSRFKPVTNNIINNATRLNTTSVHNHVLYTRPPQIININRYATYRVDDANYINTTHEQSQANPILSNYNGYYQHPPYVRSLCDLDNCEHHLCYGKLCGSHIQDADVGHATHSATYPGVKYISSKDSSGKDRPEYMVKYENPIENNTQSQNVNSEKTKNLNENKEALNNVHMNSSRKPCKKTNDDLNDDKTNIN